MNPTLHSRTQPAGLDLPPPVQSAEPVSPELVGILQQLGSESWNERRFATVALFSMGESIRPQLISALQDPRFADTELVKRVGGILSQLNAQFATNMIARLQDNAQHAGAMSEIRQIFQASGLSDGRVSELFSVICSAHYNESTRTYPASLLPVVNLGANVLIDRIAEGDETAFSRLSAVGDPAIDLLLRRITAAAFQPQTPAQVRLQQAYETLAINQALRDADQRPANIRPANPR